MQIIIRGCILLQIIKSPLTTKSAATIHGTLHQNSHEESTNIHDGLACLLRNCKNEENDSRVERMAPKTNPYVHMETMEETENQSTKPDET